MLVVHQEQAYRLTWIAANCIMIRWYTHTTSDPVLRSKPCRAGVQLPWVLQPLGKLLVPFATNAVTQSHCPIEPLVRVQRKHVDSTGNCAIRSGSRASRDKPLLRPSPAQICTIAIVVLLVIAVSMATFWAPQLAFG